MTTTLSDVRATARRRWLAVAVVCLAQLMITLDITIVNVALPSIQRDLHFSQGNLTWVVNAFLITFGSFLLLAGRLGDLFGRKRLFLLGLTVFTGASLLCGLAPSEGTLIVARFVQGFGAALQGSVILAIIVTEFTRPDERAKAMSAYVFTAVAGGSLGLLAGGALTEALSWHWIFFVNIPIGLATLALARVFVPGDAGRSGPDRPRVDILGSALATAALMGLVYAIIQISTHGWGSANVLAPAAAAVSLLVAFVALEARIDNPIMPLRILRLRTLVVGSLVRGMLTTGMYATFFLGTLYLEHVRHYTALQTGLAFLPWTLTVAALSLGVTARLIGRIGPLRTFALGMTLTIGGLVVLTGTGPHTAYFPTLFLAFFAFGLGVGNAFTPLMTMAMADVPAADAGLGSGITTLAQQVGGALGLAALGTIAASHTRALLSAHVHGPQAIVGGDHLAYTVAATVVFAGIVIAALLLRARPAQRQEEPLAPPAGMPAAPTPAVAGAGARVAAVTPTASRSAASRPAARHAQIRRRFVLPYRTRGEWHDSGGARRELSAR